MFIISPLPGETVEEARAKQRGRSDNPALIETMLAGSVELVGTPETVAEQMGEVMEEVGGDGFLFTMPGFRLSRRSITEVTDGLVPALERRGLVRTEYRHTHLRDTLAEF